MKSSPVFLLGNPRSGTTMLRLMLTCHPEIGIPPESEFIVRLYPRYGHLRNMTASDLSALRQDLSGHPIDLEEQWEVPLGDIFIDEDALVGLSYAEVCNRIYHAYQTAKGLPQKPNWGDKNNAYGQYIDLLTELFPQARFIHLLRDGRAVLNSYRKLTASADQKYAPLLPKESREVALRWTDTVSRIERHLERYASGRSITVRYEDLLDDPERQCRRLCEFLDVPYDAGMLEFHIKNAQQGLEPRKYGWKANTFQPIDREKSENWRTELSAKALEQFETIAGTMLRRYGYVTAAKSEASIFRTAKFRAEARLREVMRHIRVLVIRMRSGLTG